MTLFSSAVEEVRYAGAICSGKAPAPYFQIASSALHEVLGTLNSANGVTDLLRG